MDVDTKPAALLAYAKAAIRGNGLGSSQPNGRQHQVLDSGGERGRHCVFRFASGPDYVDATVPLHPRTGFRRSFERFPGLRQVRG